jgi:hypothetical protein
MQEQAVDGADTDTALNIAQIIRTSAIYRNQFLDAASMLLPRWYQLSSGLR